MKKVQSLVSRLLETSAPDLEHSQTVRIGERQHQMLRALAEFSQRSKSALAGELLMAAIEDAIDSLPTEPFVDSGITGSVTGEPISVRDLVQFRADEMYRELLREREYLEELAGNAVREAE